MNSFVHKICLTLLLWLPACGYARSTFGAFWFGSTRQACVLLAEPPFGDEQLHCWNAVGDEGVHPNFNHPTELVVSEKAACVLDQGDIKCWRDRQPAPYLLIRNLVAPHNLAINHDEPCVLDGDTLRCWGMQAELPEFRETSRGSYTQLVMGTIENCLLGPAGFSCFGGGWSRLLPRETSLFKVREVSAGSNHICAIDESGVVCWGDNVNLTPAMFAPPPTLHPHGLVSGDNHACLIDEGEVKCWGDDWGHSPPDDLPKIVKLEAHRSTTCGWSEEGKVRCWGGAWAQLLETAFSKKIETISSTELSELKRNLNLISPYLYKYRRQFLERTAASLPDFTNQEAIWAHVFVINALQPILSDIHTDRFQGRAVDHFKKMRDEGNKKYAVVGFKSIPLTKPVILVALNLLRNGLTACRDYLADKMAQNSLEDLRSAISSLIVDVETDIVLPKEAQKRMVFLGDRPKLFAAIEKNIRISGFSRLISLILNASFAD